MGIDVCRWVAFWTGTDLARGGCRDLQEAGRATVLGSGFEGDGSIGLNLRGTYRERAVAKPVGVYNPCMQREV
jgi:hypothetical protein